MSARSIIKRVERESVEEEKGKDGMVRAMNSGRTTNADKSEMQCSTTASVYMFARRMHLVISVGRDSECR